MTRLRRGSRAWRAARRLHHAATESVAHAHGWLPRGQRLPPGSYEPPRGLTARTVVIADAATQLHDRGSRPLGGRDALTGLDYPGDLSSLTRRAPRPGSPGRHATPRTRTPASPAARPLTPGPAPPAGPCRASAAGNSRPPQVRRQPAPALASPRQPQAPPPGPHGIPLRRTT